MVFKINHVIALRRMMAPLSIMESADLMKTDHILSQSIQPVIDYLKFVEMSAVGVATSATITGNGWVTIYTMPDQYIARFTNMSFVKDSGTMNIEAVAIMDSNGNRCIIDSFSAATSRTSPPMNFWLRFGEVIQVLVSGHSVNGTVTGSFKFDGQLDITPK